MVPCVTVCETELHELWFPSNKHISTWFNENKCAISIVLSLKCITSILLVIHKVYNNVCILCIAYMYKGFD